MEGSRLRNQTVGEIYDKRVKTFLKPYFDR